MAVMVALAGVDLVGSPVAVPEAEASTNSHWVQGVYMVPSGAPRSDREWVVDTAMKQTQAQWANFGLTFNLAPITTVYSGKSCGDYQADPLGAAYEDLNGNGRRNIHFMVYSECLETGGGVNSGNVSMCFNLDGLERNISNAGWTGCIGHELGHGFTLWHENCGGIEPENAEGLRSQGLPDYATNSIMCNGGTPLGTYEDPTMTYIRDRMLYHQYPGGLDRGCNWFYECSGGGYIPRLADTFLTNKAQQIRNANGDCLDVPGGSRESFAVMQTWDCVDNQGNQLFRMIPARTNVSRSGSNVGGINFTLDGYNIRSLRSGMCVDAKFASQDAGADMIQHPCSYDPNMVFYVEGETLRLKHSGLCLAATGTGNGSRVAQQVCDGSDGQRWTVTLDQQSGGGPGVVQPPPSGGDPDIPTVVDPGAQVSTVGVPVQLQMSASMPVTWYAQGLPDGLSIDTSTGLISGTPTTAGSYNEGLVSGTNLNGCCAGYAFMQWTVQPAGSPVPPPPPPPGVGGGCSVTISNNLGRDASLWAFNDGATFTANVATVPAGVTQSVSMPVGYEGAAAAGAGDYYGVYDADGGLGVDQWRTLCGGSETLGSGVAPTPVPTATPVPAVVVPTATPVPTVVVACASDAGSVTWTDTGSDVYWVYKSTDGGVRYNWVGRWKASDPGLNPQVFVDADAVTGDRYQVRERGGSRTDCSVTAEAGPAGAAFACAADAGSVTWTDVGSSVYWVYKSTDGGQSYNWVGRWKDTDPAPNPQVFVDESAVAGERYQVRQPAGSGDCSVTAEAVAGVGWACAADAGSITWTDVGSSVYWVYKSTDGGQSYSWVGRWKVTDPAPNLQVFDDASFAAGDLYQVHTNGQSRTNCTQI